jgi:hypothetical protein
MLKVLSCVNCESMNSFTRYYPSENFLGFLLNFYRGISFYGIYSRYSDVSLKNDMRRKV